MCSKIQTFPLHTEHRCWAVIFYAFSAFGLEKPRDEWTVFPPIAAVVAKSCCSVNVAWQNSLLVAAAPTRSEFCQCGLAKLASCRRGGVRINCPVSKIIYVKQTSQRRIGGRRQRCFHRPSSSTGHSL